MEPTNWAGNYRYRAQTLHRPSTLEEVQETVARAPRMRAIGSRHSFTEIADSGELVTLDGLPAEVEIDRGVRTVSFNAGMRYGTLAEILKREQLALANLASLPHISVAGAVATATHGSGDGNPSLASAVAGLELVKAEGELMRARRGDAGFDGLVVGLGALGVITRVTLDVEPAYEVSQRVFLGLSRQAVLEHFDEITAAGYSVSLFTLWGEDAGNVWVKRRVGAADPRDPENLFGALSARSESHPIPGLDPINATPQLGVSGLWSERLPHFRMGFTPSSGDEIQSEYLIPRPRALAGIEAVRRLAAVVSPLLQVSEIRTIAADDLWMSPQFGIDTIAIHFTWLRRQRDVERALGELESALLPLGARPHWGKLFLAGADVIAGRYERHRDFVELAERLDPRGKFRNPWLERHVLGARSGLR
jgi:xylitol oxidase